MGVYEQFQKSTANGGTSVYARFQAQSGITPKPSLVSRAVDVIKKPISYFANKIQPAFDEKSKSDFNLTRGISKEIIKTWTDTVKDTSVRFGAAWDESWKPGPNDKIQTTVKIGQAGLGMLNVAFAPITGAMKGLETVPGIGWAAAGINGIFAGVGGASSDLALKGLERLPIKDETKRKLEPLVSETAALVGMIAAGKGTSVAYNKVKTNTQTILDTIGNEALKPVAPSIKTAPKPVYERFIETTGKQADEAGMAGDSNLFRSQTNLKLQEDARRVGIDIADESIPLRERMSMVENFKTAQEIVRNDPAKAEQMLFERSVPPEVEVGSLYRALKEKALADGDPALIERLAKTSVGTESARALKSFDEGTALNADPVEALQYIRENRLKAAVGRDKTLRVDREVMKTKKEVGKILPPDKMTWNDFIKSIEC